MISPSSRARSSFPEPAPKAALAFPSESLPPPSVATGSRPLLLSGPAASAEFRLIIRRAALFVTRRRKSTLPDGGA